MDGGADTIRDLLLLQASEDQDTPFIQQITFLHNNTTVLLFLEQQIQFLRGQFHNNSNELPTVIHVDTTFNLADFFLLVTSVRCDLFIGEPLVLGPLLLTKRQKAEDYDVLCTKVAKQFGEHAQVLYFITDGEEALIKALKSSFPYAHFLRCSQHLIENMKRKAAEIGLPAQVCSMITKDITKQYDFQWASYDDQTDQQIQGWMEMAKSLGCDKLVEKFIIYFKRKIAPVVMENLSCLHSHNGILTPISNHAAESVNAMIKRTTGKKNKVADLVVALKDMVLSQSTELSRGFSGISQKFMLKCATILDDEGTLEEPDVGTSGLVTWLFTGIHSTITHMVSIATCRTASYYQS